MYKKHVYLYIYTYTYTHTYIDRHSILYCTPSYYGNPSPKAQAYSRLERCRLDLTVGRQARRVRRNNTLKGLKPSNLRALKPWGLGFREAGNLNKPDLQALQFWPRRPSRKPRKSCIRPALPQKKEHHKLWRLSNAVDSNAGKCEQDDQHYTSVFTLPKSIHGMNSIQTTGKSIGAQLQYHEPTTLQSNNHVPSRTDASMPSGQDSWFRSRS